jgi:predicted NBD/HSP70 family sugar kinase|nr:ROK family protein [uncultured Schaedlerella sp.]
MKEKMQTQERILMVVDIGGSKYMPGFVDGSGNILYQERREWTAAEPEAIVGQLKEALHHICARYPELAKKAEAGGLTIPGFADPISGIWVESDYLIVKNLPICDILSREFGIPFFADNDCNACALAEKYFGGAKEQEDFLYLTVSTGIGGALFLNGELYYGGFWHAGEIGLFVVEEGGRWSDSGSVRGVVEMYASGRGFAENYLQAGGQKPKKGEMLGGPEISRLAKEGEPAALKALELEGCYLGRIIANACAAADFRKIILGGGLSMLYEQYQDALCQEFGRIQPDRKVEIEATQLGYSGAFLGAAAVAARGLEGFRGSRGAGKPEECILHVELGDSIESMLEVEGKCYPCKEADFGSFLAAETIASQGQKLKEIPGIKDLKKIVQASRDGDENADQVLSGLGGQIGKGLACACILLDPGKVILKGTGTQCRVFQESLLETVKRETYYRGTLPFSIVWEK